MKLSMEKMAIMLDGDLHYQLKLLTVRKNRTIREYVQEAIAKKMMDDSDAIDDLDIVAQYANNGIGLKVEKKAS